MVFFSFIQIKIKQAVSRDTAQTPRSVASDLGLHCLPMSQNRMIGLCRISALYWIQITYDISNMRAAKTKTNLRLWILLTVPKSIDSNTMI